MFAEFLSLLKTLILTGAAFFALLLILLALPKSRLRSVGLELSKYAGAAFLVFLTLSPVDTIPDGIPVVGWLDDVAYIVGAVAAVRSATGDRKQRQFELTCENARLAREAGIDLSGPDLEGGQQ